MSTLEIWMSLQNNCLWWPEGIGHAEQVSPYPIRLQPDKQWFIFPFITSHIRLQTTCTYAYQTQRFQPYIQSYTSKPING